MRLRENIEHEQEEERIYDIQELLERVDNLGEVLDNATEENRKKIVHFLVKEIIVTSDTKYNMVLYFYEDIPDFKCLDNECTAQGVRWKKI